MTPAEIVARKKRRKPRRQIGDAGGKTRPWTCGIKAERDRLGLSQDDVCKAVGLSKSALSVIEHGTDPQLTTAYRLAKFFGKTIAEIWERRY